MMPGYKKSIVNFIASRVKRDILDAGNRETKEIFEASRVLSAFIEVRVASVNEAFQLLQHPQFFGQVGPVTSPSWGRKFGEKRPKHPMHT